MIQKCIIVLKMLAYSVAIDAINEYCHLVETIAIECLKHFVKTIHVIFECEYLWQSLRADLEKQLGINGLPRDVCFVGLYAL
jgi:hypothetical protein